MGRAAKVQSFFEYAMTDFTEQLQCKDCIVSASNAAKMVVQGLNGYIVAEKEGRILICSLKEEQRIKEFSK